MSVRSLLCFNFYPRWSLLVLRNGNGKVRFMHSGEGVPQRNPLAMIAYGIGILPVIKNLKRELPSVTTPWYADIAGALGMFARIDTYFDFLMHQGPGRGYYPELSKSILILHPENPESRKLFGAHHRFKVCMGTHYLGGYIKDDKSKSDFLIERMSVWERNI